MQIQNVLSSASPYLRFFFFCDSVVQRDDRQIDVTGLLSDCLFTNVPIQMPPCELTFTMVVGIHSEDRFATYALKVTAQDKGKPEEPIWRSQIGLINDQYKPIKIQSYDVTFRQPGTYWFNAYLDGELAGRYPLTVEYAPMSTS